MTRTSYVCSLDGAPLLVEMLPIDWDAIAETIRRVAERPTRFSLLKLMAQSPWDYLRGAAAALEESGDADETLASKLGAGPGRDSETALRFGTAVHRMILGSPQLVVIYDRAAADAAAPPKPPKRSKEGKHRGVAALLDPQPAAEEEPATEGKRVTRAGAAWVAFNAEHTSLGHTILLPREYAEARSMADMILRSPRACEWLFDGTEVEQRIDWRLGGRAIRSTPDARRPRKWVTDLKSCQDSAPLRFGPQVYRMLYHAQLETYCRAAEYVDGVRPEEARIVAIDRKRPPRCYVIPPEGLELGAQCLGAWIEQLKTCEASKHFPFNEGAHTAMPPEYLMGSDELLEIPPDDEDDSPQPGLH